MVGISRVVDAYGDDRLQVGEWFVPTAAGPRPTVVLVHGGFWRKKYDRHLQDAVAADLAARGYLCWNIDYRSAAAPWPATLTDAAAAYDHLFTGRHGDRVDRGRVAIAGHSAGGQLVAWLAARHRLAPGAPGHNPDLHRPSLCVPQAGVVALTRAATERLGRAAPQRFIGGEPDTYPERYAAADPVGLLPTGVRSVLIHDAHDHLVPISQSQAYIAAATAAGDDSVLEVVPGDHFSHIDPTSEACARMRQALDSMGA